MPMYMLASREIPAANYSKAVPKWIDTNSFKITIQSTCLLRHSSSFSTRESISGIPHLSCQTASQLRIYGMIEKSI